MLDTGFLAGAARLAPHLIPHIKAVSEKVELSVNRHGHYYQFGDSLFFVFRKNLLVLSTNKELLEEAMTWSNSKLYKEEELEAVNARLKEPLRIFANGKNLLNYVITSQAEAEKQPEKKPEKKPEKIMAMRSPMIDVVMVIGYLFTWRCFCEAGRTGAISTVAVSVVAAGSVSFFSPSISSFTNEPCELEML